MEISDLTMDLSELGQASRPSLHSFNQFGQQLHFRVLISGSRLLRRREISQGVRSSTRAVRQAEGRLRGLVEAPPATGYSSWPSSILLWGARWKLTAGFHTVSSCRAEE